jgi:hypothetical protein
LTPGLGWGTDIPSNLHFASVGKDFHPLPWIALLYAGLTR